MAHILIVDDEDSIRTTFRILFQTEGHEVDDASGFNDALALLKNNIYDIVVTDLKLQDGDGINLLQNIKDSKAKSEVILLTAHGSIKSAISAMKIGAFEYITKPIDADELMLVVQKALERNQMVNEITLMKRAFRGKYNSKNILGESKAIQEVLQLIDKISDTDVSVLIQGESGTGKELIAKAIHNNSLRANGPFVALNCSGLSETLLDSELFGHVKGAFTDAVNARIGYFEAATNGTLFLDEIGTMPLTTQSKLLRTLQEQTIQRLGSTKPISINTRIISASNKSLTTLVAENLFREDLFFRLRVLEVNVPPLRERKDDIPLLANYFLHLYNEKMKRGVSGFSKEVIDFFYSYTWPGNVRELEHGVESAIAVCGGDLIEMSDLSKSLTAAKPTLLDYAKNKRLSLHEFEKEFIMETLKENNWNRKRTAEMLGIGRNTLWRKIAEYQLPVPRSDEDTED